MGSLHERREPMTYKAGDVVRHQGMAEWGLGKVQDVTGDGKVVIRFTGRPSDVMLTAMGASAHLRRDSSEWQDVPRARVKGASKSKAKAKAAAAAE
jgi:transcription elongation factor GreA-like protein